MVAQPPSDSQPSRHRPANRHAHASPSLLIVDTGVLWSSPTRAGAPAPGTYRRSGVAQTIGEFGPVKVLLVEDEAHVAASLKVGLRAEGFVVVHAETGTEGLWQATENRFDVIILDIMLPGPSGYENLWRVGGGHIWRPNLEVPSQGRG